MNMELTNACDSKFSIYVLLVRRVLPKERGSIVVYDDCDTNFQNVSASLGSTQHEKVHHFFQ